MTAVLTTAAFVGVTVASWIIGTEALGWLPPLTRLLMRIAVRLLPFQHRARYLEEWQADAALLARDRPFTALLWSLGVLWRARGLGMDLGSPSLDTLLVSRLLTMARSMRRTETQAHLLAMGATTSCVFSALLWGRSALRADHLWLAAAELATGAFFLALGLRTLRRHRRLMRTLKKQ
ncbi:MAG: hypothetical protein ACTHOE_10425 [Conexibacter sp.]